MTEGTLTSPRTTGAIDSLRTASHTLKYFTSSFMCLMHVCAYACAMRVRMSVHMCVRMRVLMRMRMRVCMRACGLVS